VDFVVTRLGGDIALELAHLRGEHHLRLHFLGLRGVDCALVAVPERQRDGNVDAGLCFTRLVLLTLHKG
jgi:hypothetical protein